MNVQPAKVKKANRSLNQLINQVRQCQTESEEAKILKHESAEIRDFVNSNRKKTSGDMMKNMSKIIYLHMLGYSTSFAQLECINLVISDRFCHKRMGYLAAAILLDVSMDTHLLLTNALKRDLCVHSPPETINLALNCLSNLQSPALLAEFIGEISLFLKNSQREVRKKAMILAGRIVQLSPQMAEMFFAQSFRILASDGREHLGLVYPSVVLMTAICATSQQFLEYCRANILTNICHLLEICIQPRGRLGHFALDVFSVTILLRFLKVIGRSDPGVRASLRKTLNAAKAHGKFSLVHEVIICFSELGYEEDLGTAFGYLTSLLHSKHTQVRFSVLTLFLIFADSHTPRLESLRECLLSNTPPVSELAMKVICKIVSRDNVESVVEALILFLSECPNSLKSACCRAILTNSRKFMISADWYVGVVLRTVKLARRYVDEELVGSVIGVVGEARGEVLAKVVGEMGCGCPQLVRAGLWCLGEFGKGEEREVELIKHYGVGKMAGYGIVALTKMGLRVGSLRPTVRAAISAYSTSPDPDIQQRACECLLLLDRVGEDFFSGEVNGIALESSYVGDKLLGDALASSYVGDELLGDALGVGDEVTDGKSRLVLDGREIGVFLCAVGRDGGRWLMDIVVVNRRRTGIGGLSLKVAVPRNVAVEVSPPSSCELPVDGKVTQRVSVETQGELRLKLRVEFDGRAEDVTLCGLGDLWD